MNQSHSRCAKAERASVTTLEDWGEIVRADLTRAVDGLIAAGRHLRQAKREHKGAFTEWIESGAVGIGPRQCQRLMRIAGALDGLKSDTACRLPKDGLVMYELVVQLDRRQLEEAIRSGRIHPALNRAGARAVIAALRGTPPDQLAELQLVQQRWDGRRYIPRPPVRRGKRSIPPTSVRSRPTPPVWARLVALGALDVAALDRGDADEWEKLAATVAEHRRSLDRPPPPRHDIRRTTA